MASLFLSDNNITLIYSIIKDHLKDKHSYIVGNEYISELIKIMKYVQQNAVGKKNNVSDRNYIKFLNKNVLNEAVPLFSNIVQQSINTTEINPHGPEQMLPGPERMLQGPDRMLQGPNQSGPAPNTYDHIAQNNQFISGANNPNMGNPGTMNRSDGLSRGPESTYQGPGPMEQLGPEQALRGQMAGMFTQPGQQVYNQQPMNNYGQQYPGPGQQYPGPGQQYPGPGQQYPGPGQQYPGPGQQEPNNEVTMLYDRLVNQRSNGHTQQPSEIDFRAQLPGSVPNVDSLYQSAEQSRSESDIMTHPNAVPEFLNGQQIEVLERPTPYVNRYGMSTSLDDIRNMQGGGSINVNGYNNNTLPRQMNGPGRLPNGPGRLPHGPRPNAPSWEAESTGKSISDKRNTNDTIIQRDFDNHPKVMFNEAPRVVTTQTDISHIENYPPQPSSLNLVIPKTSRNLVPDSERIPHILPIDSRDRNHDTYENENDYRVDIPDLKEVVSIELISAEIPNTSYIINENNNELHFDEGGGELVAIIPVGNYTPNDLAAEIKTQMDAAGTKIYTVIVDLVTEKYTISSTDIFELLFSGGTEIFINDTTRSIYKANSIGPVIGFRRIDLSGSDTYEGQNRFNLNLPKYILIHILELDNLESHTSDVNKAFAKIILDVESGEVKYFKVNDDYPMIKYFSPPLGKLSTLSIQFKTYDGNFYNFNGHENSLMFRIITKDETKKHY